MGGSTYDHHLTTQLLSALVPTHLLGPWTMLVGNCQLWGSMVVLRNMCLSSAAKVDAWPQVMNTIFLQWLVIVLQIPICKQAYQCIYPYYSILSYSYGYGSISISTIFSGMNIHLPAILMFTRGIGFWPIPIFASVDPGTWNCHVRKLASLTVTSKLLSAPASGVFYMTDPSQGSWSCFLSFLANPAANFI